MKRCPNCKTEYTDDYMYCAACGASLQSEPTNVVLRKNNAKIVTVILAIIAIAGIVGSLYFYGQYQFYSNEYFSAYWSYQDELSEMQAELDTYKEEFGYIEELFGFGSENYFAEQGVVVLSLSEGAQPLEICFKKNGSVSYHIDEAYEDGISARWSEDGFSDNKVDIILTPKAVGVYQVSFTNKTNDDHFNVLTIVTE